MEWAVSRTAFRTHLQAKGEACKDRGPKLSGFCGQNSQGAEWPGRVCRGPGKTGIPRGLQRALAMRRVSQVYWSTPVIPTLGELRQKDGVSSKPAWAIEQDFVSNEFFKIRSQAKKGREETSKLVVVPDFACCVCPGGLCFLQAVTWVSWRKEVSPPRP